ncbi:hypothetical protein BCU68_07080 [Vibrio sp. 10N.286.49.B3]|uniref:DUF547 domain-containing protein n=1 Tax=Vibrio sp. 10N.286.49.B3 TaxID=1880855 RepID=UPI000C83DC74|nr:DUF547 domain-containing protein [Vibrio sp. 10N.286.49.B3]PMH39853.1 hypothetical protein BCU68_07080 [Vibrio sp. 10N.286.49.B3]
MKYIISIVMAMVSLSSWASPKAELWPFWQVSNEANSSTISHQAWQTILDNNLQQQGQQTLFDYAGINSKDKQSLSNYLNQLQRLDPRQYNKAEQYAYWVNLYNALTVKLIIDNYPISSITKLGGLFSFGPWGEEITTVAGKSLSLNDIEHRILRPIWQDARTHYAVNCASLGCPNLQTYAFTASNTQALLEQAATQFINSDKGVKFSGNKLQLSSIYEWFIDDFGSQADLFSHLKTYRADFKVPPGKISYEYDWQLNNK